MPEFASEGLIHSRWYLLTVAVLALGFAVAMASCGDDDDGNDDQTSADGRNAELTVTGVPATLQNGPNADPATQAVPTATLTEGDPTVSAGDNIRNKITSEFADRPWADQVTGVTSTDNKLTVILQNDPPLSSTDLKEVCTLAAGSAFAPNSAFTSATIEDTAGKVLIATTGPQCQ